MLLQQLVVLAIPPFAALPESILLVGQLWGLKCNTEIRALWFVFRVVLVNFLLLGGKDNPAGSGSIVVTGSKVNFKKNILAEKAFPLCFIQREKSVSSLICRSHYWEILNGTWIHNYLPVLICVTQCFPAWLLGFWNCVSQHAVLNPRMQKCLMSEWQTAFPLGFFWISMSFWPLKDRVYSAYSRLLELLLERRAKCRRCCQDKVSQHL